MERLNYYNPTIKFDRKALTEVWEILNEYEEEIDEIPEKYMWIIEDNMDKDYIFIIDDFDNMELRDDTKKILAYFYTEFLSTEEEKSILKQLAKIQYEKNKIYHEKNKNEIQYPIFNKKDIEEKVNEKTMETIQLPIKSEKSKIIFNKIKTFFTNLFAK